MIIVADQNIPLLDDFFSDVGKLVCLPGRQINPEHLREANILLVRSVTQVNEQLLKNSQVKFIGSCTIGMDHIDTDYLRDHGISWANAPGCNAGAVVQYVLSAIASIQPEWRNKTVGIIGCGNIGGRLLQCLVGLGVRCLCYDPFLSPENNPYLVSLPQVLAADIISCHTPLTYGGPNPTFHMLGKTELANLKPGTLLINSSRGAVIDNLALLEILKKQHIKVVLDVWENEPNINQQLLNMVDIATPHIAGYSLEGKEMGTFMVYQALSKFLARLPEKDPQSVLTQDKVFLAPCNIQYSATFEMKFNELLLACYDIKRDDEQLRLWKSMQSNLPKYFDELRKQYPPRREYMHFIVPDWAEQPPLKDWLSIIKG